MKAQHGFTLIELMIVVAVISILSAIALPSYRDYVIRGKIPDATSNLATKRVQQEQFFQDNRTYAGGTGCAADTTTSRYFNFDCLGTNTGGAAATATTYLIEAIGKDTMAGFTYSIDQSNNKVTNAVPSGWGTAPIACWVTKKEGVC
jgi:type IV pilus assembly protein PilE